jgi:hypothetical protein
VVVGKLLQLLEKFGAAEPWVPAFAGKAGAEVANFSSRSGYLLRLYAQDRAGIAAMEGMANAMRVSGFRGSVERIRWKLRGVSAVVDDPGATQHERATAAALKARLEQRLKDAGSPAGGWTDNAFRLGKWAKNLTKPASPQSPKGDWGDDAFRLVRALRRGYRNLGL